MSDRKKEEKVREVNESCLSLLLIELVEVMTELSEREINSSTKVDLNHDLEALGFRVGQGLMEKYLNDKDKPRFEYGPERNVNIIKFLCREFWIYVFKKEFKGIIRRRGENMYINDDEFPWIKRFSSHSSQIVEKYVETFLNFPKGLLRGALSVLDFNCVVKAEMIPPSSCTFTFIISTISTQMKIDKM